MRVNFLLSVLIAGVAEAQHGIEVQRFASSGEYYKALTTYQSLPDRIITDEVRASAAESAWALSLPGKAAYEFDKILRSEKELSPQRKARILISRGIIEYQEGRYQESALFAEKALSHLPEASVLRARANMLLAQTYQSMKSYGLAEDRFSRALLETSEEEKGEILYQRGTVRVLLGKYEEAKEDFKLVPLGHDRTPQTMKALARLAFDAGNWDDVQFWIKKGREEYADQLLDSWIDYALIRASIEKNDLKAASAALGDAKARYPESDAWLLAGEAAIEVTNWKDNVTEDNGSARD